MFDIDIKEDEQLSMGHGILDTLLTDRTMCEHIIWATDDYASMGDGYGFFQHIMPPLITGEHKDVIQPRVAKSEEESDDMAHIYRHESQSSYGDVINNEADKV